MSIAEKVEHFNREVIGINREPGQIEDNSEFVHLVGNILEELDELKTARDDSDFIGQLDALADLIYFAYGGFTRMGIKSEVVDDIIKAVHSCNMSKAKGKKEARVFTHNLDAVKPAGWVGPEEKIIDILDYHYGDIQCG